MGVAVTEDVPPSTMTVFTLDQFTVAVRAVVDAPTVHSVSWARPLAVLQRKNDTANHALVDATVVSLRVKVIADCEAPFAPMIVPVVFTSLSTEVVPAVPPEDDTNATVRVVSTSVANAGEEVAVPVPMTVGVVPLLCTVLPSLSVTTSQLICTWWLLVVAVSARANCTLVTPVPVARNSARTRYSPSIPAVPVPACRVKRMNDLLVSTPVPSVMRLFRPLVAPAAVAQAGVAPLPPMHAVPSAPRCTVAPS